MIKQAALVSLVLLAAVACGGDDPAAVELENNLVFTRGNGTRITFPATAFAWCGPWEEDFIEQQTVHVLVGGAPQGFWWLQAVVRDIRTGERMAFPNNFIFDQPRNAQLFINDPPNELSTQESESSGGVTFERVDCASNGELRFSIDAVVGSEFGDGPTVRVQGTFRAPISEPPR